MCGQAGILIGKRNRQRQDMTAVKETFTCLLAQSEHRGPMASGVAWLDASGSHRIYKAPKPASRFVTSDAYVDWLTSIPPSTTMLMGHTRWPTQGSHLNNRNNHPLADRQVKPILVTHNGNIPQVMQYFKQFCLPRRWGVDSEILVRLARQHALPEGIEVSALLRDMMRCSGNIAAVLSWTAHPETIILIRRDRPLFLAWHRRRCLLAYASERAILAEAIGSESGWHIERMNERMALVFDVSTLPDYISYDFQ